MKQFKKIQLYGLLLCVSACSASSYSSDENSELSRIESLRIFAAAGTRPATNDICDLYEKQTGVKVERNFASSGMLARQISTGAQTSIFVSANQQWIDFLGEKQMLKEGTIQSIAGNSLVVIAPKDSPDISLKFTKNFDIASAAKHIAVGDPAYVPVGKYTDAVFKNLQWHGRLKGRLILAKDVSAVLHYVELGECQLGVVYRSEALASSKVKIVAEIPTSFHKPIVFYIAELNNHSAAESAHQLRGLFLNEGKSIFIEHGFQSIEP